MYTTELMEKILTSESGQRMIQRVTNKYGDSYVGLWLFQVIGLSNDEVKATVDDFKLQVAPQTATWSLPWWERSLGLDVDDSLSLEERRQNCIEKKRQRLPINPARIEQIISAIAGGVEVCMNEYAGKNRFAIYIYDVIPEETVRQINQKLKQIKQSHKVFDVYYEKNIDVKQHFHICSFAASERKYQAARIQEPAESSEAAILAYTGGFAAHTVKRQAADTENPQDGITGFNQCAGGFAADIVKYQTISI